MKKALQGFWRGGLLGGLLGFLGGEVFCVGLVGVLWNIFGVRESTPFFELILEFLLDFVNYQLFSALPGLLFGIVIGGILGVFSIFVFDRYSTSRRIVFLVIGGFVLHVLVVAVFYIQGVSFGHLNLYEEYIYLRFLIWPIYLLVAILYGYFFPTFKPRWPKFLRKKKPQTE